MCWIVPARTAGSLGINDQGNPGMCSLAGDTAGPLGINDLSGVLGGQCLLDDMQGMSVVPNAGARADKAPEGAGPAHVVRETDATVRLLAAVAYGEASTQDVYEEMAAIANVIVRQQQARSTTLKALLGPSGTFAFAASDGNARVATFRKATPAERAADA